MISLSIKNRIAFYYILGTAFLILLIFIAVHQIVSITLNKHIDDNIQTEVSKHLSEYKYVNGKIELLYEDEWMEREHNAIDVNPVFVEFVSAAGQLFEKSPNLKEKELLFDQEFTDGDLFDTTLDHRLIRQIQVPLYENDIKVGYLLVAMSRENAVMVILNLERILLLAYPFVLVVLFFLARIIAGKSIQPVQNIIKTSRRISERNLSERVPLPENKDELYELTLTINNLIERIEKALEREKEFTSHASHELRTPLAVLQGTLEVLIRKPREEIEYRQKINFCITEIKRMNTLVDDLLMLARIENTQSEINMELLNLQELFIEVIQRFAVPIQQNNIEVQMNSSQIGRVYTDKHLFLMILNNLISNAIKYNVQNGALFVDFTESDDQVEISISDTGIGFSQWDENEVFNQFFRSQNAKDTPVKGTGLGLAIVKKLSEILAIPIEIKSILNQGTVVRLILNKRI
ncbi:HAMP domain-containing sensor histidine kinase [Flavobacterium sp. NKUCC04_CG]|uniref:sensor histidine kinase n=1 Tax=Flavobacterium sp. NKUCC04_CG TaxID=2842121 RepID=UPI001C5A745B|nr:HAMP domain-containing sensor histidine kinase [Flavobacterium sp. NKUCC04_CG]MBW3519735.1 HAMP domain-containing histidine kinase [Flavobacterium sp. NKUCC04_CG]